MVGSGLRQPASIRGLFRDFGPFQQRAVADVALTPGGPAVSIWWGRVREALPSKPSRPKGEAHKDAHGSGLGRPLNSASCRKRTASARSGGSGVSTMSRVRLLITTVRLPSIRARWAGRCSPTRCPVSPRARVRAQGRLVRLAVGRANNRELGRSVTTFVSYPECRDAATNVQKQLDHISPRPAHRLRQRTLDRRANIRRRTGRELSALVRPGADCRASLANFVELERPPRIRARRHAAT